MKNSLGDKPVGEACPVVMVRHDSLEVADLRELYKLYN